MQVFFKETALEFGAKNILFEVGLEMQESEWIHLSENNTVNDHPHGGWLLLACRPGGTQAKERTIGTDQFGIETVCSARGLEINPTGRDTDKR